jgi:hypothetical protein
MLRLAIISAILLGAAAIPARADSGATLSYTLTGPISASWTMSQDPTALFPTTDVGFLVFVPNLVVGGEKTPDFIGFFNTLDMGGINSATDAIPDLIGPQVYKNGENNPIMLIGTFDFIDANGAAEVLTVKNKAMPEPGTLLLLSAGLLAVGWKRKNLLAPVR